MTSTHWKTEEHINRTALYVMPPKDQVNQFDQPSGQPPTCDQTNGIPQTTYEVNGGPQTVAVDVMNMINYDQRSPQSGRNTSARTDTVSKDQNNTDCNERDDEDNSVPAMGMQETESPTDDGASAAASGLQELNLPA
ncbi:uncharacterized protein [Ptychodera flava]|uniref:uncharacterized protein n=1 Tax=Ptychodera flava TaxID=63121 RepID=UPI003969DC7B